MLNTPQSGYEPEQKVGDAMMLDSLSQAIEQLPERDQIIMALYYTEDLNLKEIGAVLDISESRVSQLLSANVKKAEKDDGTSGSGRQRMALFGPSDKELKATAKEYDKGISLKGDSRKEEAYRMRIALRARGHVDKLFLEAAQKAEKFNDIAMMCIAEGKPAP